MWPRQQWSVVCRNYKYWPAGSEIWDRES